jgi:hypothetical protein
MSFTLFSSRTGASFRSSGQEVIFKSAYNNTEAPRSRFTSNPTLASMNKSGLTNSNPTLSGLTNSNPTLSGLTNSNPMLSGMTNSSHALSNGMTTNNHAGYERGSRRS